MSRDVGIKLLDGICTILSLNCANRLLPLFTGTLDVNNGDA